MPIQGFDQVPRDPLTMRQGPGETRSSKVTRFAFLSDAHVVETITGPQQRLIDWCLGQIKGRAVDRVVLGGDITHRAQPIAAHGFLDQLSVQNLPVDYLPGNNEGPNFQIDRERYSNVHPVLGCQAGGEGWPDHVFLLQTTNAEDAATSVRQLMDQWPTQGNVLVLAHFPPELTGEAFEQWIQKHPDQQVWWICGHRHASQCIDQGNLHVVICAGLDPIKVRGQLPALLTIDWDGDKPTIQYHHAPETLLHPAKFKEHPVGLAYRDTAEGMVETGLRHGIACLQFHYQHSRDAPSEAELAAVERFRQQFKPGFLSLHLPNFTDRTDGPDVSEMEPWLAWAQGIGLDDLTVHLPKAPVSRLFDSEQQWLDTPWARACRHNYVALAERAIAMGAQLSLENHYNREPAAPEAEKLSSRPWHLIRFVEMLRSALRQKGYAQEQTRRIGVIFDTGHAFRDPVVSKIHGLADWIHQLSPFLQLSHIHQVGVAATGKRINHQPITQRLGPLINYAGVLAAIEEMAQQSVPLLVEVRDREDALASWRTLTSEKQTPAPRSSS